MPQKKIIFGKKLTWKVSNALFRELERYYGIKILQTGEINLNQSGTIISPAGGKNPRRHPRSPRVYTYKDKEYLLKK